MASIDEFLPRDRPVVRLDKNRQMWLCRASSLRRGELSDLWRNGFKIEPMDHKTFHGMVNVWVEPWVAEILNNEMLAEQYAGMTVVEILIKMKPQ